MRTLQEKYNGIQEGKFSKDQFLVEARQQLPNLVTRYNGYADAVQILKNRGMIQEAAKVTSKNYKGLKYEIHFEAPKGYKVVGVGELEKAIGSPRFYKTSEEAKERAESDIREYLGEKETVKEVYSTEESFKDYSDDALTDMIINSSRFEGNEEGIARVKAELARRKAALNEAKQPKATKKGLADYRYKPTNEMDKYPYEQILRGLRVELETLGVKDVPTAEEYTKALAKVSKNLEKDSIFYTNQVAGVNPKVDLHDKLIPINQKELFKTSVATPSKADGNKDTFNDLKKAQLKEGFKKLIKKVLTEGIESIGDRENWKTDSNDPLHDYMESIQPKEEEVENYRQENGTLDESPAKNNPKIEKLVNGINDLIAKAVDIDGDPIGIVDTQSTWQEPEVYSPIEYRNGALKITSKSPYRSEVNTEVISSKRMGDDGIETLKYLMRKYKQAAKKAGTDLYPEKEDLDEAAESEKYRGYVIEVNIHNQANSPHTKFTYYNGADSDEPIGTGSSIEDCKAQIDEKLGENLNEMYGDSDGDYDHDKDLAGEAERLYDAGYTFFLKGELEKAEALRQAALEKASLLSWGDEDLPPYEKDDYLQGADTQYEGKQSLSELLK